MPLPAWALALIGAGVGGLTQGLATKTQNAAISDARRNIGQATGSGIDVLTQLLNASQGQLAPFQALGPSALQQAANLTFRGGKAAGVPNLTIPGGPSDASPSGAPSRSSPYDFSSIIRAAQGGGTTDPLSGLSPDELDALNIRPNAPVEFGTGPNSVPSGIFGRPGQRGLFGSYNSSKDSATTGVNLLSDWTWNKLKPAIERGELTPDQGLEIFNTWWAQWIQSMKDAGVAPRIIESSIADQSRYIVKDFNNFISGLGTTSAPGATPGLVA